MIPDNVLQEIVAANEIVETISSYLPLKKAGKDYKALCPFHNEKTPSFTVSVSKQIFHCFGCGAGGDVIGFVMKIQRMEFPDAVELLAQRKGIRLVPYRSTGGADAAGGTGKKKLYEVNAAARDFFASNLRANAAPQEYLKARGITGLTARDFSLGWAQPSWDALLRWGLEKGFSKQDLLAAGLIIQSEETPGQVHDRFRGRVIFPLFDTQDRVIAFSGRVLDDALPKYINSPETGIFSKGAALFGLNMAKEEIIKTGWVAVCEGPMDMIGVYQAGIRNIVASQGTAFTQRHAKLIKRFASYVVLCFDGDQAGQMAILRSLDVFLAEGMDVKIAVLPAEEDPDSYVRSRGREGFAKLVSGAVDFLTFRLDMLRKSYDLTSEMGIANAAREVFIDLVKQPSAVYQNTCVQKLSELLGVREEALWLEFKKLQSPPRKVSPSQPEDRAPTPSAAPWEIDWVAAVIQNEELLERESREGHFDMLSDRVLAGIVRVAVEQFRVSDYRGIASVSVLFRGTREAEVLAQVACRPVQEKGAQEVYEEGLMRFSKRKLEARMKELTGQIERLEREKADVSSLLDEVSQTKKELLSLDVERGMLRR